MEGQGSKQENESNNETQQHTNTEGVNQTTEE